MILTVRRFLIVLSLLAIAAPRGAQAQPKTQNVQITVNPINVLSFAGSPTLTVVMAEDASTPVTVDNTTASWSVTTNQTGAKVTASIPMNVPAGLVLSVHLAPPTGATSRGFRTLSTVSTDLVTGITKRNQSNQGVTYRLSVSPVTKALSPTTRVVTYTITGGT